jgi:hypothetical protein
MTVRKPLTIDIENDCGTFYVVGVEESEFTEYFYATYVLADKDAVLDYEKGYQAGLEEAVRRILV